MTTTRPHGIRRPRPSQRLAIDPYRVDDTAWTREEILAARGYPCTSAATMTRRRAPARPHR